jgi:hypothetical protein
LNAHAATI